MSSGSQYELIDFGQGRKLERFGAVLVDRPAPNAGESCRRSPAAWRDWHARYERLSATLGHWTIRQPLPADWHVAWGNQALELMPSASGAVGVFPEQAENWDWIGRLVRATSDPVRVLNLFAYTGGSTLAAAAAGASVAHVDAARPVVNWARRNAARSRLKAAPIRWIVEDARRFVSRELRRNQQYDAIILDPPTYGHGPRTEAWLIDQHLLSLLADCMRLTGPNRLFVLLTCHAPNYGPGDLAALLASVGIGSDTDSIDSGRLTISTGGGRLLPSGVYARWAASACGRQSSRESDGPA